jgi:hypothetical protein
MGTRLHQPTQEGPCPSTRYTSLHLYLSLNADTYLSCATTEFCGSMCPFKKFSEKDYQRPHSGNHNVSHYKTQK